MIEIDFYSLKESKTQRQLKFRWVLEIIDILRSVHIVLDSMILNKHDFIFHINNYVDWDSYNTLYNMNFMKKSKKIRNKFLKKQQWSK